MGASRPDSFRAGSLPLDCVDSEALEDAAGPGVDDGDDGPCVSCDKKCLSDGSDSCILGNE
jgi:hypothetical protein